MQSWSPGRGWVRAEVLVVLALSLGRSAVYSLLALTEALAAGPLSTQSTALNPSLQENPWLDLLRQLLSIGFTLAPVGLVVLLLAATAGSLRQALGDLGLDLARPARDLLHGVLITAGIGIPGLAVYYLGRLLGATVEVVPAALDTHWWTVPVLVLHALTGDSHVVELASNDGYLLQYFAGVKWHLANPAVADGAPFGAEIERLGWSPRAIVLASAVLRGAYHTYQGIGPGLANLVMGLVFGAWYLRTRRTMPLVIAHTLLDVVAFVGYALLKGVLGL